MYQKITESKGDKTMEQKLLFFDIDGTLITEGTGKDTGEYKKSYKNGQGRRPSAFCEYRQDQDRSSRKSHQSGF